MTDLAAIIARVRELDAAATKGPWHAGSKGHVYAPEYTLVTLAGGPPHAFAIPPHDAALIAEFRTAAPLLAAECARLRERVGVLEEALREIAGYDLRAEHSESAAHEMRDEARAALKGTP